MLFFSVKLLQEKLGRRNWSSQKKAWRWWHCRSRWGKWSVKSFQQTGRKEKQKGQKQSSKYTYYLKKNPAKNDERCYVTLGLQDKKKIKEIFDPKLAEEAQNIQILRF